MKKIALISGGTSGIGLSLVKELVSRGYFVHFIGSNPAKGNGVERDLGSSISKFHQVDLSHLESVKEFCNQFQREVNHLDILINCAGVILPRRQITSEGFEKTFAIGYLAAFILSTELVELLKRGSNPRIVNMGGRPKQILKRKIDIHNINTKKYNPVTSAFDAIHAKTVLTQTLSLKYKEFGIDVNSFHPGAVKSDLGQNMNFFIKLGFKLIRLLMKDKSETAIYVVLSRDLNGVSGKLFSDLKPIDINFDQEYRNYIWSVLN